MPTTDHYEIRAAVADIFAYAAELTGKTLNFSAPNGRKSTAKTGK